MSQVIERLDYLRKEKSEIPLFFELQMAFPYLVGEQYLCDRIQESRKKIGGGLNETLLQVYKNLPHSTSQLLGFPDTVELGTKECLKADSYGLAGIASLLAPEVALVRSIQLLKTLEGDRLCLTKAKESNYKLEWRIRVKDEGDRTRLRDIFSNYFSHHIRDSSFFVTNSNGQIEIAINN